MTAQDRVNQCAHLPDEIWKCIFTDIRQETLWDELPSFTFIKGHFHTLFKLQQ